MRWIRYQDWIQINDILLPENLTWYAYEERTIKDAKDSLNFENVSLYETSRPYAFYMAPENAKVVLKR